MSVESTWLNINGQRFVCNCGCKLFHKPYSEDPDLYECNACELQYVAVDGTDDDEEQGR